MSLRFLQSTATSVIESFLYTSQSVTASELVTFESVTQDGLYMNVWFMS